MGDESAMIVLLDGELMLMFLVMLMLLLLVLILLFELLVLLLVLSLLMRYLFLLSAFAFGVVERCAAWTTFVSCLGDKDLYGCMWMGVVC